MNPAPQGPAPLQYGQYSLPPNSGGGRFGRGLLGWLLFIALAAALFVVLSRNKSSPPYAEIPLSEFYRLLREDKIEQVTIHDDEVRGKLAGELLLPNVVGPKKVLWFRSTLPQGMGTNWAFTEWVLENAKSKSTRVEVNNGGSLLMNIVVPLIPWVLIFGFIWFFVLRQLRGQAGRPQQPLPVVVVNPGAPGTVQHPGAAQPPPGSAPAPDPSTTPRSLKAHDALPPPS